MTVVAVILVVLAGLLAVGNIGGHIDAIRRHRRGESGGYSNIAGISLLLCILAWVLARDRLGLWAFLPAILDPGTWSVIVLPFFLIRRRDRLRAPEPVHEPAEPAPPAVAAVDREVGPPPPHSMPLYSLDREGTVGVYANASEAESLEWIDVENGEYVMIDDDAFVCRPVASSDGVNGFQWRRTRVHNPELLERLRACGDGARLSPDDLRKSRTDFIDTSRR